MAVALPGAAGQPPDAPLERILFSLANQARLDHHLSPLRWSNSLSVAASDHANAMLRRNEFAHEISGEPKLADRALQRGEQFSAIAENIAIGPSTATIQAGWMRSPGHRANLLNPEMNAVGIAVVHRGASLWAVEDFAKEIPVLTLEQQEQIVIGLLDKYGLTAMTHGLDKARLPCEQRHATHSNRGSRLVSRYSTDDLTELPANLVQALAAGNYRQAEVCAYVDAASESFAHYNILVELF